MASNEIVTINGKTYDAKTGLPVEPVGVKFDSAKPSASKKVPVRAARKVVVKAPKKITVTAAKSANKPKASTKPARSARKPAPSQTLNRRFVPKPVAKVAKKPTPKPAPIKQNIRPTISVRPTPVVPRGIRRPVLENSKPEPTGPDVNPELLAEAKQRSKASSVVISCIAVVVIALAVLAYFFVPIVSFTVASARAEVKTSMPTYAPQGYSVNGTAQSSPGLVVLTYKSATSGSTYSISMANSNWDSDGVLENKVKPVSENYQTLSQKGLTIFIFGDQAMWVNGGVLYTISLNTTFTNEEILKIVDGI